MQAMINHMYIQTGNNTESQNKTENKKPLWGGYPYGRVRESLSHVAIDFYENAFLDDKRDF